MQTSKLKGGGGSPRGESLHGIWKSDVRGVSGGEEFSQNADTTLERNIKCSNLSQGFCSVTKKKREKKKGGSSSLSNNTKLTITHFTFFQKGAAKLMPLWEKSQAFMHANEVNSEQMCSTPELKLEQLSFFYIQWQRIQQGTEGSFFLRPKCWQWATIQMMYTTSKREHPKHQGQKWTSYVVLPLLLQ